MVKRILAIVIYYLYNIGYTSFLRDESTNREQDRISIR